MSQGNKLNSHKSWNVSNAAVQRKIREAQERTEAEQKRIEELRRDVQRRQLEELVRTRGASTDDHQQTDGRKKRDREAWMDDSLVAQYEYHSDEEDGRKRTGDGGILSSGLVSTTSSTTHPPDAVSEDVGRALKRHEVAAEKERRQKDALRKARDDPMASLLSSSKGKPSLSNGKPPHHAAGRR
jgi:hypothetical protein